MPQNSPAHEFRNCKSFDTLAEAILGLTVQCLKPAMPGHEACEHENAIAFTCLRVALQWAVGTPGITPVDQEMYELLDSMVAMGSKLQGAISVVEPDEPPPSLEKILENPRPASS